MNAIQQLVLKVRDWLTKLLPDDLQQPDQSQPPSRPPQKSAPAAPRSLIGSLIDGGLKLLLSPLVLGVGLLAFLGKATGLSKLLGLDGSKSSATPAAKQQTTVAHAESPATLRRPTQEANRSAFPTPQPTPRTEAPMPLSPAKSPSQPAKPSPTGLEAITALREAAMAGRTIAPTVDYDDLEAMHEASRSR